MFTNDSKKRGITKKSLDSRINGQNAAQVPSKKPFYFKDDGGNIVVMNDAKSSKFERCSTHTYHKRRIQNFRNSNFENCQSENVTSKANHSEMRKTTRPMKIRKKPMKKDSDSVRDPTVEL
mmetsp:Transcript_33094/g.38007  ORF Transcript_33094/g.38007 Transcript_33094/m.38007 type:complete len:121 (-) Transcript_33094:2257-2619(-)